jgi:hypothetical protein
VEAGADPHDPGIVLLSLAIGVSDVGNHLLLRRPVDAASLAPRPPIR